MGRDQTSVCRLQFSIDVLLNLQNTSRLSNHQPSAVTKSRCACTAKKQQLAVGTLVYIKHEGNKFSPREVYVIVHAKDESASLQKMNRGKFSSRKYSVPMDRLFPCVGSLGGEKEKKAIEPI